MIGRANHLTFVVDYVDEDCVVLLERRCIGRYGKPHIEFHRHT
jgi:hypothetical protein